MFTNNNHVPLSVALWLAYDDYDHKEEDKSISVTTLIKPVRQIILPTRLEEDASVDIASLVSSSIGRAVHSAIENVWLNDANREKALNELPLPKRVKETLRDTSNFSLEQRVEKEYMGWKVSGKYDFVLDGTLEDFKVTKTYAYNNPSHVEKYVLQGSIYRWLNPEVILDDHMFINYIFTDYFNSKSSLPNYPPSDVVSARYELMSLEETENYVRKKLALIDKYINADEKLLPKCTDKDLWRSETLYKYFANPDSKRSSKNFTSQSEAQMHMLSKGKGHVKEVLGEVKACKYCPSFTLCSQKNIYLETGELKI